MRTPASENQDAIALLTKDQFWNMLAEAEEHMEAFKGWYLFEEENGEALQNQLAESNACLAVLTSEREEFIRYCQSLKLATGEVGPIQVARAHIERLVSELEEVKADRDAWKSSEAACEVQFEKLTDESLRPLKDWPSDTLYRIFWYESLTPSADEMIHAEMNARGEGERVAV